jgi:hypothetical protein
MTEDVQRSLGRIEGILEGIREEQKRIADELEVHTVADAVNFLALNTTLSSITGARKTTILWASGVSGALVALIEVILR